MNQQIKLLNDRLRERLGTRGGMPLFQWMWAPEVFYFYRPEYVQSFARQSWGERLGKVWVLCQFRSTTLTRQQWWECLRGEFAYPERGMYYAQPEIRMPIGMEPTDEATAIAIIGITEQMEKTEAEQLAAVKEGVEQRKQRDEEEWADSVNDLAPAFDNWHSGTKNGVEFQVPGTRDESLVTA